MKKSNVHFCNVHFEKQSLKKNACFQQHEFLVGPLGVLFVLRIFKIPCFFDPKKESETTKKSHLVRPIFGIGPQKIPKGPLRSTECARSTPAGLHTLESKSVAIFDGRKMKISYVLQHSGSNFLQYTVIHFVMWSSRWKGTASRTAETTRREKRNTCDIFDGKPWKHKQNKQRHKRKQDTSWETMGNTKKETG